MRDESNEGRTGAEDPAAAAFREAPGESAARSDPGSPAPRRLARAEAVLAARRRSVCIVLEDTHDPHNVSAALRTCEAFGIQGVHLVAEVQAEIAPNPRVTIGSERWLTVYRHRGSEAAIAALRAAGYRLYVSHLEAEATPLPDLPRDAPSAYVFGNERSGVTDRWLAAADATFLIPTSGFTGSLNLSVAVALTLYDRLLGRPGAQLPAGDLHDDEKAALRSLWYAALAHGNADLSSTYQKFLAQGVAPQPTFGVDRNRPPARSTPRPDVGS